MSEHAADQNLKLYQNQLSYRHEVLVFLRRGHIALGKLKVISTLALANPSCFLFELPFFSAEIFDYGLKIRQACSMGKRESTRLEMIIAFRSSVYIYAHFRMDKTRFEELSPKLMDHSGPVLGELCLEGALDLRQLP